MEHLQSELDRLLKQHPDSEQLRSRLETLVSVYPFNDFEFLIAHLLAAKILSLDEYMKFREGH